MISRIILFVCSLLCLLNFDQRPGTATASPPIPTPPSPPATAPPPANGIATTAPVPSPPIPTPSPPATAPPPANGIATTAPAPSPPIPTPPSPTAPAPSPPIPTPPSPTAPAPSPPPPANGIATPAPAPSPPTLTPPSPIPPPAIGNATPAPAPAPSPPTPPSPPPLPPANGTATPATAHSPPPSKRSRIKVVALAAGTSAAGIGIILCLVIWYCVLQFNKRSKQNMNLEAAIKQCGSIAPKRYSYSDVKKMTNSFKDKLGKGGYGDVYKGNLFDNRPIAVKVLNTSKGSGEDFINEVASISRTSHVNVVTLLGFCLEGQKRALIYEFMPNGSLERYVHAEKASVIDGHLGWEKLYQIALGIARGLEYLHKGCTTRIVHFDIKPHNILLDQDFCPKISDFGLSKLCTRKESIISMLEARGTIGYIAPEVVSKNFGDVSHKSDIYSYGMMLLEMVGGRKNICVEVSNPSKIYFPRWVYQHLVLDADLKLQDAMTPEEDEIARKMILVGLWCIQTDPSQRPAVSKVIDMLEGSLQALEIPPKPFFGSRSTSPENSCSAIVES